MSKFLILKIIFLVSHGKFTCYIVSDAGHYFTLKTLILLWPSSQNYVPLLHDTFDWCCVCWIMCYEHIVTREFIGYTLVGFITYTVGWWLPNWLKSIHTTFLCEYLLKCATASTVLVWCCCRIILQKIKRENMSYHCDNLEVCHFTEASSSIRYNIIKNLVHTVEKQWFH